MTKEIAIDKKQATKMMPTGIDINKLVEDARASYGKKEAGLAKQIATGSTIVRPDKDSDYVLWRTGDHWLSLCGIRGIPFGKIVQISGKPDSGKSTHAMCFMKEAQDQGCLVILWDAEGKFSRKRYDEKMGGNSSVLAVVDTNGIIDGAKHIANIVKAAKEQNPVVKILIVWDSVGASQNSTESGEETEDFSRQPGVNAREIGWAVKKFNRLAMKYYNRETGEHSICTLVVNQVYANIGSVGHTEKGGGELYYLSSLILQLSRKKDLNRVKQGKHMKYGIVSRAKVKKNHLFDGDECVAELDLEVSASGISLFKAGKPKSGETDWADDEIVEVEDDE